MTLLSAFAPSALFVPRRALRSTTNALRPNARFRFPAAAHAALAQVGRDTGSPRARQPFVPVEGAAYYTACGGCKAIYTLDPTTLGDNGRKVQCAVCENTWFQRADRLHLVDPKKRLDDYPLDRKDEFMAQCREKRRTRRPASRNGPSGARRRSSSVFVGNLPYTATEDALRDLISSAADVDSVIIVKDRETGRSRGFGFVNVATDADVRAVVSKFDGVLFNGRTLTMREGNKN